MACSYNAEIQLVKMLIGYLGYLKCLIVKLFNNHCQNHSEQEIDGKALLLLNSDMMMKYMGLKLGPALKICNLVSRVKGRRHNLSSM